MTTAACTSPSTALTTPARSAGDPRGGHTGTRLAGTRITTLALALRRWWERRDVLIPVGPEPAGPWAAADRPDRDRARVRAELARGGC